MSGEPQADVLATKQLVGIRMGYLMPQPLLLISQRFRRLLLDHRIKGAKVGVAHVRPTEVAHG